MAEKTGIAWTTHTWSPWIGCTEVSEGCTACYARVLDARYKYGGAVHWGAGVPRYRTKQWEQPLKWNKNAAAAGERRTVFPSLCDPFDNEVPREWRMDLFRLIEDTPRLTWLLLTKRIGNVARMLPFYWLRDGDGFRPNVWIGASVVNQEEADRDIPKLLATPAAKRFISYEPAIAPVYFSPWLGDKALKDLVATFPPGAFPLPAHLTPRPAIDWVIVGGESSQGGAKARPFRIEWARSARDQCRAAGVPFFFKQAGSYVVDRNDAGFDGCDLVSWPLSPGGFDVEIEYDIHGYQEDNQGADCRVKLRDRAGADPAEWPEDLRVQETPT